MDSKSKMSLAEWENQEGSDIGSDLWCVQHPRSSKDMKGASKVYAHRVEITPNGDLVLWGNRGRKENPTAGGHGSLYSEVVVNAFPKGR